MCDLVWSPNVPPKTKKCSQKTQMDRLIEKNAIFILLRAMSMHGMSCGHVRSRKNGKRKRAKQWTYYIETLKRTIDCLYEICRAEHCIIGCKEVLMYLTNSVRDFESLIDTINVEISWEKTEKPHSVAWEIRKTTMSPRQIVSNNEEKSHGDSLINMLNFSPVVLCEVVRNAEQQLNASSVSGNTPDAVDKTEVNKENVLEKVECNKENVLDNVDQSKSDDLQDEGWHLVESRHRKRGSSGRSNTSSHSDREDREAPGLHVSSELSQPRKTHMNVYERLTSGVLRPPNPTARQVLSSFSNGGRLTCPRSAMDLPQTKASMAKMAYSRQLLWQKNQTLLEEKLQERRRRDFQFSRKNGGSAPLVSSINFADPVAVTRSAQAFKEKRQKERRLRSAERKSGKSSTSNTTPSLNSIEESVAENEDEAVDNQTEVPVDMSKSDITICDERVEQTVDNFPVLPSGIDSDDEWKAMTEEEESLVQEEESLKKEIEEEECFSIDAELERQVAAEAAAVEQIELMREEEKVKERENQEKTGEESTSPNDASCWQELVLKLKQEVEEYASVSWSDIVEHEIKHYRNPGAAAQKHEKLSSPNRRRSPESVNKQIEERQQKADDLRQTLLEEKARRLKELSRKVEEVRRKRAELAERKREHLEMRMYKVEENRRGILNEIVKKARSDEDKVKEINFINTLEAENMRLDLRAKDEGQNQRISTIAAERAKKCEEKAAREAAAEERRRIAEAHRAERLREIATKHHERQVFAEAQRLEQERERVNAAREKQRQHMERMAEIKANEAVENEKLKKKLQAKQLESQRRHEESLVQVKQKAREFGSPRTVESLNALADCSQFPSDSPYDGDITCLMTSSSLKKCNLCGTKLNCDLSVMCHILSDEHLSKRSIEYKLINYNFLKMELNVCISDADMKEVATETLTSSVSEIMQKHSSVTVKKRKAKLRQHILSRSLSFGDFLKHSSLSKDLKEFPSKTRVEKALRDIKRITACAKEDEGVSVVTSSDSMSWLVQPTDAHRLERAVGEIHRSLNSKAPGERDAIIRVIAQCDLLSSFIHLLCDISDEESAVSHRIHSKVASLICDLVLSDVFFPAALIFNERILTLVETMVSKLKNLISSVTESSSHSPLKCDIAGLKHAEWFTFVNMMSRIFYTIKSGCFDDGNTLIEKSEVEQVGTRLKAIISFMLLLDLDEYVSSYFRLCGSTSLRWDVRIDTDIVVTPFLSVVDLVNSIDIALVHAPCKKKQECSASSEDGNFSEKPSFFASLIPPCLREIILRLYALLRAEVSPSSSSSSGAVPSTPSISAVDSCNGQVDKHTCLLISACRLWLILCKREPNGATTCVHDHEFSVRFCHILNHALSSTSKRICAASTDKERQEIRPVLHRLILTIGSFASVDERAQMLCTLGWQRSVIAHLSLLPCHYFFDPDLKRILLPTVIAVCYKNEVAVEVIKQEFNPLMLANYLEACEPGNTGDPLVDQRFPALIWPEVISYFKIC